MEITNIDKRDLIKLKSLCTAKESISRTKCNLCNGKKTFADDATNKRFISKLYKQLIQFNTKKKQATQSKKVHGMMLNITIREMQMKTTIR